MVGSPIARCFVEGCGVSPEGQAFARKEAEGQRRLGACWEDGAAGKPVERRPVEGVEHRQRFPDDRGARAVYRHSV